MISITEFLYALKSGRLIYVNLANYFVLFSMSIYLVLEKSDYLYEKMYSKFKIDMIDVARLLFAAVASLLITLVDAFIINKTLAVVIDAVLVVIAFLLIKNARDLPIWEEDE